MCFRKYASRCILPSVLIMLSIFAMIGVYALSIVDAYVDAELSSFDISRDLSMKVSPSVIRQGGELAVRQPYGQQAYGVRCSVSF